MGERRKPEDTPPAGCPEWMVTFSDVISLLVTFFVMILTFSTLEIEEFKKLAGSLRGGFGVMTPDFQVNRNALLHKDAVRADRERDTGAAVPFMRDLEELEEDLREMIARRRLEEDLEIHRIDGGLRIRIKADRMFDPGSDVIRPGFVPVIQELAEVLGYCGNEVIVEGHTDSSFTGSSRYPTGLELAGTLARRVAEVLVDHGAVRAKRIGVASYGASRPIAGNDTPAGRARNRRVEILVLESRSGY